MRGMIRDMLFYHARQFVEPAMRVRQARNLLDFLAKTSSRENTPYGLLLKQELEAFHRSSDSYLFHEHLEEHNAPVYFHEFAERAARAGLRYLAEVDLRVMVPANYPPEIANVLHMLALVSQRPPGASMGSIPDWGWGRRPSRLNLANPNARPV